MKLTKSQLKKIIKEEIGRLSEQETNKIRFLIEAGGEYEFPLEVHGASTAVIDDATRSIVIDGRIKIHSPYGVVFLDPNDPEVAKFSKVRWPKKSDS